MDLLIFQILAWIGMVLHLPAADQAPVYLDSTQSVERRVEDLLARMTIKEKVGQTNMPCVYEDPLGPDIPSKREALRRFTLGTYTDEIGPVVSRHMPRKRS